MVGELAPAVLDAVAAFMYGMTVITEAIERAQLGPRPDREDEP